MEISHLAVRVVLLDPVARLGALYNHRRSVSRNATAVTSTGRCLLTATVPRNEAAWARVSRCDPPNTPQRNAAAWQSDPYGFSKLKCQHMSPLGGRTGVMG